MGRRGRRTHRSRSARYPGAIDIEPDWTLEAADDPDHVLRTPDPKSRVGYTRIIGYSPGAGFVLTVIIDPQDSSGVTAWEGTRGRPPGLPRRQGGPLMSDTPKDDRSARRARHAAILAEVASEEADAAEAESAEQAGALDVPLHLRIDRELGAQLRSRALAEQIPTSALVRRLLRHAISEQRSSELTAAEVEQIARRVAREEVHGTP